MRYKVFISYSHSDEHYVNTLRSHLANLRHQGMIDDWHDRKILPGQDWDSEIDDAIEQSQLVLLLISSDFMSSRYCYGIELNRALKRAEEGLSCVIPIFLRSCDWLDAPFAGLQGLPQDAKPVAESQNIDQAFTIIAKGIRAVLNSFQTDMSTTHTTLDSEATTSSIPKEFLDFLEDPGLELRHPRIENIKLGDIFVSPDLRSLADSADSPRIITMERFLDRHETMSIVFGDEQSGLTSFAKMTILSQRSHGRRVLYIDLSQVKTRNIDKHIKESKRRQFYSKNDDRIDLILLDNYATMSLNRSARASILRHLENSFSKIIILSSNVVMYNPDELELFERYSHYEMPTFGHKKREELVSKWLSVGREDTIASWELQTEVDGFTTHIDSLVRKNVVPAKPLFLVSILQTMETMSPTKLQMTSYGHCYQNLIYQALIKGQVQPNTIDSYLNLLTELSFEIFQKDGDPLNIKEVDVFCDRYSSRFLGLHCEEAISKLTNSGILRKQGDLIDFRYKYIYYFFCGKYFADHANEDSIKKRILLLLKNLHKDQNANIAIFTTHHTKDNFILDELQIILLEQFEKQKEATLMTTQMSFMREFISSIPRLVIEQRNVQKERERRNEMLDRIEDDKNDIDENQEENFNDTLRRINTTIRGIEIVGQIIRNRYGSMDRNDVKNIADTAISSGFQFLQYFIEMSDIAKEEVIAAIRSQIAAYPMTNNDEVEREARNFFMLITYGAIYSVIAKLANSIGCREALPVFNELCQIRRTPAAILVQLNIELSFTRNLDIERLRSLYQEITGNATCQRMFRESILMYLYLHDVPHYTRGQISSYFDIPVKAQDRLAARRDTKFMPRR